MVEESWQQQGLGKALFNRLAETAQKHSLFGFTADALSSNKPMLSVFEGSGFRCEMERDDNITEVVLHFFEPSGSLRGSVMPLQSVAPPLR